MHVVNLSIGVLPDRIGAPEDFQEQLRGIIDKYTKQGMIAIAAVGNRNQGQDRWSSFVPASLPSVVSVSSMDIPYATTNSFQIHSQEKKSAPFMYLDRCSNYPQPVQEINVVVASPSANPKNCLYPRDIKGKMVLIPPNSCNIEQAIETIKIHGATGAILPNSVINFSDCSFPIVSITIEDANTIQNISKLNPKVALSFSHHRIHIPASKAMKGADHIAWGPSSKLQMNPDIMAPGTMLATTAKKGSTYSINDSRYAVMSGTSYAAPYQIPRIDPMIFKNATQRTAIPYTIASQGLAGSVPEQGAGLLHIERALLNPFSISPLVIELGDQSIQPQGQNTKRHTIAINNPTNNERVFLVTHLPALSVYGFDKPNKYSDPPTRNKLTAQALFSTTTQSQQDNSGILKKPFIQVK
ncbi:peptidase S8/S53 domain-containing protein [Syncephalis fuscata]|nr:peptidase S8/S53 domain-containing protein [Syncephalis fuscata]